VLPSIASPCAAATLAPEDRANIDIAQAVVQRVGDSLWPNWSKTPFVVALVTSSGPVFVNGPTPDPMPSFAPDLEATFPIDGTPTIVIGTPAEVQATPVRWQVTLMHEHFHQWQQTWPAYFPDVRDLGLAGDDKTGMWMLNYRFPYQDAATGDAYGRLANRLASAVDAIGKPEFADDAKAYVEARARFRSMLKPNDYRYFAFQCWQEGVARYTEIAVARAAAAEHRRDRGFLSDAQAKAFEDDAAATESRVEHRLRSIPLKEGERSDFYALGAGESLLLDQLDPVWRANYLDARMDLGAYMGGAM
jgi:hypothetical protein